MSNMIWRNINEIQPKDGDAVLVCGKYGVTIRVYNEEYKCWDDEQGDDYDANLEEYSWWMPLPEKPKI